MNPETVELILGIAWPVVSLVAIVVGYVQLLPALRLVLDHKRNRSQGPARVPAQAIEATPPQPLVLATQHQVYSHLSRMHSSLAATFFGTVLACTAYILTLKKIQFAAGAPLWILWVLPLPVLVVQGMKYYATNGAFRKCGEEIAHPGTEEAVRAGYNGTTLHDYLFDETRGLYSRGGGRPGGWWLRLTQRGARWGWLLLVAFLLVFFGLLIWLVPQEPPPNNGLQPAAALKEMSRRG